jgi:membrane-bound lytic murein transglycosylase D
MGAQLSSGLEPIPAEHRDAWRMHRVETGETLASIAKRFGVAPASIMATNSLKAPEAPVGDRVLIPAMRVDAPGRRLAGATAARRTSAQPRKASATSAAPRPPVRPAAAAASAKPQPKPVASSFRKATTPAAPPAVMLAHTVGK